MTGIVLSFPADRSRPASPNTRLARALGDLAAALAEQHAAVAAWRCALLDLKTANDGLKESLGRYSGELDRLGAGVGKLDDEARRLGEHLA